MTLTASSISTNNTLEQLRNQFNNLVTDVEGLETGTKAFSSITATTSSSTFINVLEDGNIVFEGATDDAFETTLTVADGGTIGSTSSTDTMTLAASGIVTFKDDILIKDGGTIGNASVADVMTLASTGIVTFKDDLLIKDGGTIGVASSTSAITIASTGIVTFVDDILIKDGGTIGSASSTGAITIASSGIVTLVDDLLIKDGGTIGVASSTSAITIASTGIVTFVDDIIIKDAGTIGSASDTDAISISSGGVVNISATTANTSASDGALTVAGGVGIAADASIGDDLRLISDSAVLSFGADSDTTLTHTDGTGLTLNSTNKLTFGDTASFIQQSADGTLRIDGEAIIDLNASTRVDVSGALTVGGLLTNTGRIVVDDTTEATSTTDGSLQTDGGLSVAKDAVIGDDLLLLSDSAVLSFGADSDTTLTHTDGSGLTINSTNKIMFRDSALSVSSSADGQLDIDADTEVEITATTIDINGAVEISGTTTQTGVSTSAAKDVFNAGLSVKNGSTSAGFIEFFEDSDNGTNKVTLIGPASSGDVTLTLPAVTDTVAAVGDITALAIALG